MKHKIFVAGNHDIIFETSNLAAKEIRQDGTHYLEDSSVVIDGIHFYGSPWQPAFYDWAFNLPRNSPALARKWESIPSDTDVLITHGPPYGILDVTKDYFNSPNHSVGCELLRQEVADRLLLKLHCFGHIHHSYGQVKVDNTLFVNAAICDESYQPTRDPIVVEI